MQIFAKKLWSHDASTGTEIFLKEFGYPMHLGPVGSISICRWKPIAITAGEHKIYPDLLSINVESL